MQITWEIVRWRRLAIALEIAAFLAPAGWAIRSYVAGILAETPTIPSLRGAVEFDPGNADHRLRLARLLQYSVTGADPKEALTHLERATELDRHNPAAWLALGIALESQGKDAEARDCLERADFLAPNDPTLQWSIGNALLLRGSTDKAFQHFRKVLAGSSAYDPILFRTAWKASGDATKILQELVPDKVQSELSYLNYLVLNRRFPAAQAVWRRIVANPETFPVTQAAGYLDMLIAEHRLEDASQVWIDLCSKRLLKATYEQTPANRVINGDFEERILGMGFDWRTTPIEDVDTAIDDTTSHSPGRSFLIEFSGKQNVEYRNLFQYVRVVPGHAYRLRGYMKTQGITTDSGPRLEVRDAYHSGLLDKFSEDLKGTTLGWKPVTVDFTPGPRTDLVAVGVARPRSQQFDSLIAGRVWVDDISLTETIGVPASHTPDGENSANVTTGVAGSLRQETLTSQGLRP